MYSKPVFMFASILYNNFFPIYKMLYFLYKSYQDAFEIKLFKKIIKPGDYVIDIGSNIGFYSVLFSKLVEEKGKVFCFEPERINFRHLKNITKNLKNTLIHDMAVSDSDKPLKIYTSKTINVDHRTYSTGEYGESYQVKATTIDSYVKSKFKIDFIKMDIQGAEFFALKGMRKVLSNNKDIIVFMEYWPVGLNDIGVDINKLTKFFYGVGFKIYTIQDDEIKLLTPQLSRKYISYKNYDFDNWIITRKPHEINK